MTIKINPSVSANTGFSLDRSAANRNLQSNVPVQTDAQYKEAISHLNKQLTVAAPDDQPKPKQVADFMREILQRQPIDEAAKKKSDVLVLPKLKPLKERRAADYENAAHRALFDKAGYRMLTDKELDSAVTALNAAFDLPKITDQTRGSLREQELKTGQMTLSTDKYTIEAAKRAGQAALQYSEYQARQIDEAIDKGNRETTIRSAVLCSRWSTLP